MLLGRKKGDARPRFNVTSLIVWCRCASVPVSRWRPRWCLSFAGSTMSTFMHRWQISSVIFTKKKNKKKTNHAMNVRRNKYTPEALIKHKFVSILRSREKFENVYEITSLQYGDWFRTSEVIIIFFLHSFISSKSILKNNDISRYHSLKIRYTSPCIYTCLHGYADRITRRCVPYIRWFIKR